MPTDTRITFVTSPDTEQRIRELARNNELTVSKTVNKLIETAVQLDVERVWKLQQAEAITNFKIIDKLNEIITA